MNTFFVYLQVSMRVTFRNIILLGLCGLLLCSCMKRLDPYMGTNGVRANINGDKYVMLYLSFQEPSAVCEEISFSMYASLIHIDRGLGQSREMLSDYSLSISLESNSGIHTGGMYTIGDGKGGEASLGINSARGESNTVPLQGWIRFTSLTPTVTARFELESPGKDYEVRHGLLRMKRR